MCFIYHFNLFNAQIIINSNDFASNGEQTFCSRIDLLNNIDFSLSDSNYNWDFSNLLYTDQDSVINYAVSQTPFSYQLYFNNVFLYPDYLADYAQKEAEIDAMSTFQITERYGYFKNNNTSLEKVGFGAKINGVPTSVKYDTIDQLYFFPLSYQDQDSSRAYYLVTVPSLGTYGQWIRRTVEVDGWGSVSTPYNTYDVLRIKTVLKQRDTVYVDQFQYGTTFDQPDVYIYEWLAKGIGFPVFKAVVRGGNVMDAWYLDDLHVGFDNDEIDDLYITPNPVIDQLNINVSDQVKHFNYRILNLSGFEIFQGKNDLQINTSFLSPAPYLLEIWHEDYRVVRKWIKL